MNFSAPRSFVWLFWLLAALGLAADQASKYGVHALLLSSAEYKHARLPQTWTLPLIPGAFDLQIHYEGPEGKLAPHVNRGAVNGWLNGWDFGNEFFAVVSFLAACAIVYWIFRPTVRSDRILCVALGLILGGTLGNLYDRIVFNGVRDFLHWHLGFIWPDFNIADSCLVCGAGLLLLHALFVAEPQTGEEPARAPRLEAVPAPAPVNTLHVPGEG
jgi:signal peptidase II